MTLGRHLLIIYIAVDKFSALKQKSQVAGRYVAASQILWRLCFNT